MQPRIDEEKERLARRYAQRMLFEAPETLPELPSYVKKSIRDGVSVPVNGAKSGEVVRLMPNQIMLPGPYRGYVQIVDVEPGIRFKTTIRREPIVPDPDPAQRYPN